MRRAFRSLASRPLLTVVAIATLALGLGVNAAVFSLTREVLLRPLPYRDADRLVRVFETSRPLGRPSAPVSPSRLAAWRERVDALDEVAMFRRVAFNVSTATTAVQLEGFQVSPSFLPMLGVATALGRGITTDDALPGRDSVVLLSHGAWQRRFGGDAAIVGRTIDIDGAPCTVVGVLPATFTIFRVLNREVDLFRPLVFDATDREQSINVYARLRPDAALDLARAQLATAYALLPAPDSVWSADLMPLSTSFAAQSRPVLLALQWTVALVLVIACANIANLLLTAAVGRRKELAVRSALGAGRWRIARDLAGETIVLTTAGAAAALLVATWIVAVLNAAISFQDINRLHAFQVDGWVFGFAAALTLGVTAVFALLPAHEASRTDVVEALKESTSAASSGPIDRRLRSWLVVAELALAVVLTTAAVSLTRSVVGLQTLGRGFDGGPVMTAQVSLTGPRYERTDRLVQNAAAIVERLAATQGIADTALVNYPPVAAIGTSVPVAVDGYAPPENRSPIARYWVATPNYFRTLRIPFIAGRDFAATDDANGAGVAIVSEGFARRFWNTAAAVGRRVTPEFPSSDAFWIPRTVRRPLTVVGVVADVREEGIPEAAGQPQLYLPFAQNPTVVVTLLARAAAGPAEALMPAMREAVRAVDPQAPLSRENTLDGVMRDAFTRPRELAWLIGTFSALALCLAAIGVYGVMAHLAAAREREIRIRIALGATMRDIVRLVVGQASATTAAGIAIGTALAPIALGLARGMVFGMGGLEPTTLVMVAGAMAAIAIAASAIPAIRAGRRAEERGTSRFI